jgi:methane monooxygenase component A gamma chain
MIPTRARRRAGAERRMDASPFGDRELRLEWASRIAALRRLDEAVATLIDWRDRQSQHHLTNQDALWIGARLEDRTAVLRFEELSNDTIRTVILTGEPIKDVCENFERRAAAADANGLEALADELRRLFKPPIMPSSPYMRLEVVLSEALMKKRSLNWFEPSLTDLRARRGAKVLKEGWPDKSSAAPATP